MSNLPPTLAILMCVQVLAGVGVMLGSIMMLAVAINAHSRKSSRWGLVALTGCGCWYALEPLVLGRPTTTLHELGFAIVVAWALLQHADEVISLLDGYESRMHKGV